MVRTVPVCTAEGTDGCGKRVGGTNAKFAVHFAFGGSKKYTKSKGFLVGVRTANNGEVDGSKMYRPPTTAKSAVPTAENSEVDGPLPRAT